MSVLLQPPLFFKGHSEQLSWSIQNKKYCGSTSMSSWCPSHLGRPTMEGKTARGASSPPKPALHMPLPLSTTSAFGALGNPTHQAHRKYDTPEKNELELGEHGNLKQFCNSNLWDLTEKIGNNCIDKRTSHRNLISHACLWRQKSTGGWQNVNQDWAKKCWSSWVASAPHQNLKWFQNQLPLQWLLARGKFWAPKLRGFSIALSQMSSTLPRPSHGALFFSKK